MTTTTETKPWDFSHVLDFNSANAIAPTAPTAIATPPPATGETTPRIPAFSTNRTEAADNSDDDTAVETAALGDFSQVWQFLGVPKPSSAAAPRNEQVPHISPTKNDYASDGAAYTYKSKDYSDGAGLQWSDGTYENGSDSATSTKTTLTKTQRKRNRKREKKDRKEVSALLPFGSGTVSESEVDHITKPKSAQKASTHTVRSVTPSPSQQLEDTASDALQGVVDDTTPNSVGKRQGNYASFKKASRENIAANEQKQAEPDPGDDKAHNKAIKAVREAIAKAGPSTASPGPRVNASEQQTKIATFVQQTQALPVPAPSTPMFSRGLNLIPASLLPTQNGKSSAPVPQQINVASPNNTFNGQHLDSVQRPADGVASQSPVSSSTPSRKTKPQPVIEPRIIRSGEDRHWALLLKIIGVFNEDRKHLVNPANLTTHNNHPDGIHLFVDASNIFLGFMKQVKLSRGIHPEHQLPQINLSFDGLALLMERRRPVARRVLVGSTPHLQEFDKAAAVGYDCNILEKVQKSRLLTARQIHFRKADAKRFGKSLKMVPGPSPPKANGFPAPSFGYGLNSGSSSETNTALYDPPKLIEQGVDEILHMKMLESIVDAEKPSTMVLATGDAAAAEYSDGFGAMVERALKKGWNVELVSWSKSISSMYTKMAAHPMWRERFRIVYLDDFAEELLDM